MNKVVAGFAFVFTLIVASLVLSVVSNNNIIEANEWIEHTNDVLFQCDVLVQDAIELETNKLKYVVTKDEIHIQHLITQKATILVDLEKLKKLTLDNPKQTAWIAVLEADFNSEISFSDTIFSLVSTGKMKQAEKRITDGNSLVLVKKTEESLRVIKMAEKELLKTRTADANSFQSKFFKTSLAIRLLTLLGVLVGYYFVTHTMRARIAFNAKIVEKNLLLEQQNRQLEQFTYITTHDLQEPLLSLIAFTELLKDESSDNTEEDKKSYIGFIAQLATRMQTLVKGIMEYSKIGTQKKSVLVDFDSVIKEVLIDLRYTIESVNAIIKIDPLPEIIGYPLEIRLLFQNLIANALKFTKQEVNPEIKISAKEDIDNWTFSVQDNGIGIKDNDKEKIFVIFKRLHDRDSYEGTGIGLSHCEKIVRLHGGTIWVDSKINEGCTFNFTIPKNR
jgi:signal transduction histidine kinase